MWKLYINFKTEQKLINKFTIDWIDTENDFVSFKVSKSSEQYYINKDDIGYMKVKRINEGETNETT